MLIYVAGPYSEWQKDNGERVTVSQNIHSARIASMAIWEAGHYALTPHLNTAGFSDSTSVSYDEFLAGTLTMLQRCDSAYFLANWNYSRGAKKEHQYCLDNGIPITYEAHSEPYQIEELATLTKYPQACEAFMNSIMQMWRTHLSKNEDYSPANILGTGELGLMTRLWDKTARLMNLTGFNIEVIQGEYTEPKSAKHESIEDTLLDLSCYALIGRLLRAGKWGK